MRGDMSSEFRGGRSSRTRHKTKARGFTLIEAIASIALVGIGIASCMAGLAAMAKNDRLIVERETLQRLATQKYDEVISTGLIDSAELSGDFSDQGQEKYEWAAAVEPSGEENLEILTVTVNRVGDTEGPQAAIDGLVFRAPIQGGAQ